ncbi:unnamed protein product [Prorocentrum cordatum]|uniref:Secreted protein n=1 Tax=Prorocentrum cordatum TaxID=2364126 RepID=A0ABN9W618_9DINO|nr:unnamed protein product [Polarella glacialis]
MLRLPSGACQLVCQAFKSYAAAAELDEVRTAQVRSARNSPFGASSSFATSGSSRGVFMQSFATSGSEIVGRGIQGYCVMQKIFMHSFATGGSIRNNFAPSLATGASVIVGRGSGRYFVKLRAFTHS